MRAADVVLLGGQLFGGPGASGAPRADSVVLADGRIQAVTTTAEARSAVGPRTEVVALDGRLCLPGFYDAHVHPLAGGLLGAWCDLRDAGGAEDCLARVAAYAEARPGQRWIVGGGWQAAFFPGPGPTAAMLDGAVGDRPVFLLGADLHDAWVSTAALRVAGLDRGSPDPRRGALTRDGDGRPTGHLRERAADLLREHLPPPAPDELEAALLAAQEHLHRLGVTGWQDALVGEYLGLPDPLPAYLALAGRGDLTAAVSLALWWDPAAGPEQLPGLVERRAAARAAGLRADRVKIMQDGICENGWARLLEPYADGRRTRPGMLGDEELRAAVSSLAGAGFSVHFHAVGDAAVRNCLDAVEAARHLSDGLRHQVAHVQLVADADVPRFAELDVTAVVQPLWAAETPHSRDELVPVIGADRFARQYRFRSLADAGARLAGGSDWPVSSADPLQAAFVATTRLPAVASAPWLAGHQEFRPLDPAQRLSVAEALVAYTSGAAHALGLGGGEVAVGGRGDLVVLDTDVLAGGPGSLAAAQVDLTVAGGRIVHQRPGSAA